MTFKEFVESIKTLKDVEDKACTLTYETTLYERHLARWNLLHEVCLMLKDVDSFDELTSTKEQEGLQSIINELTENIYHFFREHTKDTTERLVQVRQLDRLVNLVRCHESLYYSAIGTMERRK